MLAMTIFYGTLLADVLTGGTEADTIYGGGAAAVPEDDADTILGGAGNDLIYGNGGNDLLVAQGDDDTVYSGVGNDSLYGGSSQTDTMDGSDALYAGVGSDWLYGNAGNDTLHGGDGTDTIYGGLGNDLIYGGNDYASGGDGSDFIAGGAGGDTIYGGEGNDRIFGGNGVNDASDAADVIDGGAGNDIIYGNGGDDLLIGGAGNDTIYGGAGLNTIDGGEGTDRIIANIGDVISGGTGIDRFVLNARTIVTTTTQAAVNNNAEDLAQLRITDLEAGEFLQINITDDSNIHLNNDGNGNTQLTINGQVFAVLEGVNSSAFSSGTNNGNTFTYTVGGGANNDVTPIPNEPPINDVPAAQTTNEDTSKTFNTAGGNLISVSDVDNVSLTAYTIAVTQGTLTLAQTTGLTFATGDGTSDATMTFSGTVTNINAALDGLVYAPTANYNGADTLTITANDGTTTDVNTVGITVTAINDTPTVANAIADQSAPEDAAFSFQFNSNVFNDVDAGNTLTYSVTSALPTWLSFDAASRTFSGTPAQSDIGHVDVTLRATDGSATFVEDTFRITTANTNDAPTVANAIADQSATEDAAFSFQFASNVFNDVDVGDTLTYSVTSTLPAWLSFDAATRTFSGTPLNANVGFVDVTVQASDGTANVTDTFRITTTNTNDTPTVANAITNQSATEDSAFSFQFAANTFADVDVGDTLTYSVTSALPAWLSFDAATRTFSGTPANGDVGFVDVTVQASDGTAHITDTFRITTANTNDAPTVANALVDQSAPSSNAFSYQFPSNTFADVDAGDTLTYSVTSALPAWLSFDAATRTFSGTPTNGDVGNVDITVRATDGSSAFVEDTVRVTVSIPTVNGTAGADTLVGGAGSQEINGLAGGDTLYADIAPTSSEALFEPDNVADTLMWFDASQLTGYTNGQAITSWTDIIGGNNATPFSTGPTYVANTLNGLPVVSFSGTNGLRTTNSVSLGDWTTFVIFKDSSGQTAYERLLDHEYTAGFWIGRNNTTANSFGGGVKEASDPYGRFTTVVDGQWNLLGTQRASTTHKIWGNGNFASASSGTVTSAATSSNRIGIGAWHNNATSGQQASNIDMAEVLIYSSALSTAPRELLEQYQSAKWGIALATTGAVAEEPGIFSDGYFIARDSAEDVLVGNLSEVLGNITPTYSITSGNTNSIFRINASTGEIYVDNAAALAADSSASYSLGISASLSSGGNPLTLTVDVQVRARSSDTIDGGSGNDTITGGLGADSLSGGNDDDVIMGDANPNDGGNDTIDGGAGNDIIQGTYGNDVIQGGTGNDVLSASSTPVTDEALFEPDNLSGLKLWLDGSDSTTIFSDTGGSVTVSDGGTIALWKDKSGNNNHASQSATGSRPTWDADGYSGTGALGFDGSADNLRISDANSLDLTNAFTLSVWMKSSGTQTNRYLLSKLNNAGTDNAYSMLYGYSADKAQFYASGNGFGYPSTNSDISIADTNWHLVTYTYDGSVFSRYKDGVLIDSYTLTANLTASTGNLLIGTFNAAGYYFSGTMNDIVIYNDDLSSNLVSLLYASQAATYGIFSDGYFVDRNAAMNTEVADLREVLGSVTPTYSITSGNALGIFAINTATGEIYVADAAALAADSSASYTLGISAALSSGGAALTLTTTIAVQNGNDTLEGGAGNDTLNGSAGNNLLDGGADNDTLYAKGGNDTLIGGTGVDTMTGGGGIDRFTFSAVNHSPSGTPDTILSFDATADLLVFSSLLTGAFSFVGAHGNAFAGGGNSSARFNDTSDLLEIDTDGNAIADMSLTLTGVALADLSAADFSWS